MTTAELVKRLLDAGANSDVVMIALEAIDEAVEAAKEAARPRRHRKRPEIRAVK